MEKKGDHFEITTTEEIEILKETLSKLKHSGTHITNSLNVQSNMQHDHQNLQRNEQRRQQYHEYPQAKKPKNQPDSDNLPQYVHIQQESGGLWNTLKSFFGYKS
jgi:hypothetical protein